MRAALVDKHRKQQSMSLLEREFLTDNSESVYITDIGIEKAQELLAKNGIDDWK